MNKTGTFRKLTWKIGLTNRSYRTPWLLAAKYNNNNKFNKCVSANYRRDEAGNVMAWTCDVHPVPN